MKAHLINIGDELVSGRIVNSNAQEISTELTRLGIDIEMVVCIPDDHQQIISQLAQSTAKADLIVVTGGLGPTSDDRTLAALAEYYQMDLEFRPEVFNHIQKVFTQRKRKMAPTNRKQAMIPRNFEVLKPYLGTAPGLRYQNRNHTIYIFPGVPEEMEFLLTSHLIPWIKANYVCLSVLQKTYRTMNLPESELAQRLDNLTDIEKIAKISFLPRFPVNDVVITVTGKTKTDAQQKLQIAEELLLKKIKPWVYGRENQSLEEIIGKMMVNNKLTLAVAESCTGGLVVHRLTNIAGSSKYFLGGIIAYSNQSKKDLLGIDPQVLKTSGAASAAVAQLMADKARDKFNSDIGLSTTGMVSDYNQQPGNGILFCGISALNFYKVVKEFSVGNREHNKLSFSQFSLGILFDFLKNYLPPNN